MREKLLTEHILTNGKITSIQKFPLILKQNDLKMTAIYMMPLKQEESQWMLQVLLNLQYLR